MEGGNPSEAPRPASGSQPSGAAANMAEAQAAKHAGPQAPGGDGPPRQQAAFVPPPRRRSVWGLVMMVLLMTALFVSVLFNIGALSLLATSGLLGMEPDDAVQEKYFSHNRTGTEKIAIISIEGLILDGEGFVKKQIDHARRDAERGNLKAIVLRVDSPGGTVSGSDMIYHELCELAEETEVPMVVSMGSLAASGGYYVSMAVGDTPRSIYAEPTTWTGSIGVIIPHYNAADLLDRWGIKEDSIASHPLKNMGSFARHMTEEERAIFQGLVDDSFERFKQVVRSGRPRFRDSPELLDRLATGQIFTKRPDRRDRFSRRRGKTGHRTGRPSAA